ncbi:response regulator [Pigmentiphaga soli]|uniref:Response regulator n=1 Tax=Pigmentiphaga soli TaxID=1007095 RepID=A0ABP8GPA3_9BURK
MPTPPDPAPEPTPSAALRILVVDDNRDAAEALAMLLEMFGHEVRSCFDGEAAVQAAREWAPGLVLLDLTLPGMDGCEAARRIAADAGAQRAPWLVALSGHAGAEERERTRQAGFRQHLVKPVPIEVLTAVVEQAVRWRAA